MKEITLINVRVDKAFKHRARIIAAYENISLSEWVRRVAEEKLAEAEAVFFAPSDSHVNQLDKEEIA